MTSRPSGWVPRPGDRVRYAYSVTGDEPEVDGTVVEVRSGPDIDYFQQAVVSVCVDWDPYDPSEREIPTWVILGRLNPAPDATAAAPRR